MFGKNRNQKGVRSAISMQRLAIFVVSHLSKDEKLLLTRNLVASAMKKPEISKDGLMEFDARSHCEHLIEYESLLVHLRHACEDERYVIAECSPGCEFFMDSLRHGGCVDCVRDKELPPPGLTIYPEYWYEVRPHIEYALKVCNLLMTEDELMYVYGHEASPFDDDSPKAA